MDTPHLGSIGIGELIARIDRNWDLRDEIRAGINQRIPALRERARLTHEFLVRVLRAARQDERRVPSAGSAAASTKAAARASSSGRAAPG
jgi:hypothetical protein